MCTVVVPTLPSPYLEAARYTMAERDSTREHTRRARRTSLSMTWLVGGTDFDWENNANEEEFWYWFFSPICGGREEGGGLNFSFIRKDPRVHIFVLCQ